MHLSLNMDAFYDGIAIKAGLLTKHCEWHICFIRWYCHNFLITLKTWRMVNLLYMMASPFFLPTHKNVANGELALYNTMALLLILAYLLNIANGLFAFNDGIAINASLLAKRSEWQIFHRCYSLLTKVHINSKFANGKLAFVLFHGIANNDCFTLNLANGEFALYDGFAINLLLTHKTQRMANLYDGIATNFCFLTNVAEGTFIGECNA